MPVKTIPSPVENVHFFVKTFPGSRSSETSFYRADRDQESHFTDPIASEATGFIGDWVNGKDVYSQHDDSLDWILINPPATSMLLRRLPDETEDLGEGT